MTNGSTSLGKEQAASPLSQRSSRRYPSHVIVYVAVASVIQTVVLVLSLFHFGVVGPCREGAATASSSSTKALGAPSTIPSWKEHHAEDASPEGQKKNRRKFVSYTSSAWEQLWLDHVEEWSVHKKICQQIRVAQRRETREFLRSTCTHFFERQTLCVADDSHRPIWMGLENLTYVEPPPEHRSFWGDTTTDETQAQQREAWRKAVRFQRQRLPPLVPEEPVRHVPDPTSANGTRLVPAIFSQFTFLDEKTGETYHEYIEPLVSHLRHPLALCNTASFAWMLTRSYIFPPQGPLRGSPKTWLWDAGAGLFDRGLGGPSLACLTSQWLRNGIAFDEIRAYEASASVESFYESLPPFVTSNVEYHSVHLAGQATANASGPFLPHLIAESTKPEDYVVFKLDIDDGPTEIGIVNYLLNDIDNVADLIDEFLFEHHIDGNYLMKRTWGLHSPSPKVSERVGQGVSQRDSYEIFLELRRRGVRAHSYV